MGIELTHDDLNTLVDDCCGGPLSGDKAAKRAFGEQPTAAELLAALKDAAIELRLALREAQNGQAIAAETYRSMSRMLFGIENELERKWYAPAQRR